MTLRIAFDCDGCVADLESALDEIAVRLFGETPAGDSPAGDNTPSVSVAASSAAVAEHGADAVQPEPGGLTPEEVQAAPARFRRLTRRQQHDLWEAVRQTANFWETLKETQPGAVARLAQVARERRWEVIFITQRPATEGDITQLQTQRWLTARGYDLPNVYVIKGTRGRIAEALSLDVVVDDRPENCLDVKLESRARAILVWNGDLATVPANARNLGIELAAGIGACLDLLTAAPEPAKGLLSRFKKLVGG